MHDLTLEETPIVTAEQCAADTCIHIDTHSQDVQLCQLIRCFPCLPPQKLSNLN